MSLVFIRVVGIDIILRLKLAYVRRIIFYEIIVKWSDYLVQTCLVRNPRDIFPSCVLVPQIFVDLRSLSHDLHVLFMLQK